MLGSNGVAFGDVDLFCEAGMPGKIQDIWQYHCRCQADSSVVGLVVSFWRGRDVKYALTAEFGHA